MTDLSLPTEYFKKRAKDFLALVKGGDVSACQRVRQVYGDASAKPNDALAAEFSLMRSQHVIAVEHGFASWDALMKGSGVEGRLAITMAKVPELNDFGIGLYCGDVKKPKAEQQAIFERERAMLRKSFATVEVTVTWLLENVQPTKTINARHTSYGLKHVAEKDIGYITNGVFIAAGIIAGYPYEIVADSPNVPFGMSEQSLRKLEERRLHPERVLKRFTPTAVKVLERRGIQAYAVGREGNELAWLEDGDVRTLKIGCIERTPFIVRLFVDHYTLSPSQKTAKALGIADQFRRFYAKAVPVRQKGEISVLPDEVDAALMWALNYDARQRTLPPSPPFELAIHGAPSVNNAWSYVWSKRASDAYGRVSNRRGSEGVARMASSAE